MLFLEEDAPLLKAWIVKRLENTSDADADVLADYVLALLRHEGDLESIRKLCEQETHDFLQEDSAGFVDDVFKAIAFKTYLNKSQSKSQPPALFSQTHQPPNPNTNSYVSQNVNGLEAPTGPSMSRKRTYHERGETDHPNGLDDPYSYPDGRGGKLSRRGGRGGRHGLVDSGYMHLGAGGSGAAKSSFPGTGLRYIPQLPPLDPNDLVGSMMRQWQALGIPVLPVQEPTPHGGNRRQQGGPRRKRCRDFDTKGICARGQACPFDHGSESVFYHPAEAMLTSEEYDPNNAILTNTRPEHMMAQSETHSDIHFGPASTSRGGRSGSGHLPKARGSRSPYSADGPTHDHSNTTIVVENIPEDNFSEDHVREFFGQFGDITEVSMQPYKRLAIVKYTNWGSANAAYRSPKVIFDNRFVKVFWFKLQNGDGGLPTSMPISKTMGGKLPNSEDGDASQQDDVEIDMDEFMRKQEEAQKVYCEREQKRAELDRKREELGKLQEELLARQFEERRRLQGKLAQGGVGDGPDAINKAGRSTERLRAQLIALEEEAKTMGIDPDAIDMDETPSSWAGNPCGGYGYGGLARAAYGGRGRYIPRGHSAGYRGRADVRAAYAAYSLDNRPKVVAVSGADFTDPGKDETLRHHLLNIGEFKDIVISASTTYITFSDRKTAEKFMTAGNSIPGINEKLELSWSTDSEADSVVLTATKPNSKPVAKQAHGPRQPAAVVPTSTEEDDGRDDGQDTGNGDMDYDVADENDWAS